MRGLATAAPVLAALAFLGLCGRAARASFGGTPPPSPIVYGVASIPLHFSHARHAVLKIGCLVCHASVAGSTGAGTDDLPPESVCAKCHAIDRKRPDKVATPAAACAACHVGFVAGRTPSPEPVTMASPDLHFNHALHVGDGVPCATCHGDMTKLDAPAGVAQLPLMSACLSCHDGSKAPASCATCHLANPDGTLITALPRGQLLPSGRLHGAAHGLAWRTDHGAVATTERQYCLDCHKEKECLDCHEGVAKPFDFHGNDYITLHPIDAERDSLRCASCHRRQDFCIGCHERTGVAVEPVAPNGGAPFGPYDPSGAQSAASPFVQPPAATCSTDADCRTYFGAGATCDLARHECIGPGTMVAAPSFHPVYDDGRAWVDVTSADTERNQHALQAERNMGTCVSCHTERSCMTCHADAGMGGPVIGVDRGGGFSPHGTCSDWVLSGRCQAIAGRNPRVCLECHSPQSATFQSDLACICAQ